MSDPLRVNRVESASSDDAGLSSEKPCSHTSEHLAESAQTVAFAGPPAGAPLAGLPTQAGRYFLRDEIGRGGMGLVLRAEDPDLQRPLAVKVMLSRWSENREARERFLMEARLTGQLQHPGIPPVHELGYLADGRPFFAMKLIAGRTLWQLLQERAVGAADLQRWLDIFAQICHTLAYAHSRGVIHRDLKPQNV